jgi:hypothetical protein
MKSWYNLHRFLIEENMGWFRCNHCGHLMRFKSDAWIHHCTFFKKSKKVLKKP